MSDRDVTMLLGRAAEGEPSAAAELLPLVYDNLRALAGSYFQDQRASHTLQPTALVHEAYMKLVGQDDIDWQSRNQFFVLAAKAMRSILVDHARGKNRLKRGGEWGRVTFEVVGGQESDESDLIAIDEALEKLATLDERKARLVELRFFAGMTADDAAKVLGIARSTAADEWALARAWLYRELGGEGD